MVQQVVVDRYRGVELATMMIWKQDDSPDKARKNALIFLCRYFLKKIIFWNNRVLQRLKLSSMMKGDKVQNDVTLQSNGSQCSPNEVKEDLPAVSPTTESITPFA
nr:uncharacterized protein LOC105747476 isoform X4 [Dasypus novemcinctus]